MRVLTLTGIVLLSLGGAAGCRAEVAGEGPPAVPAGLSYMVNPAVYAVGVAIIANTPSSSGGAVTSYSVSPSLPAGLGLDTATGIVSGTPTAVAATATYTVTASNSAGSTTVGLVVTVNASVVPPAGLSYSTNPAVYTEGVAIAANTPSSTGGAVTSYSVSPSLPAGLGLSTTTGVVTGTPTTPTATATYTVTASNSAGSTTAGLVITVLAGGGGGVPAFRLASATWLDYSAANSMTVPAFTTQGASRVLVACVSWYPPHTDPWPTTLTWNGGTPAGATAWTQVIHSTQVLPYHWSTEIWVATTSSVLTGVQATAGSSDSMGNDPTTGIFAIYEVSGARTQLGGVWTNAGQGVDVPIVTVTVTPTANDSLILGCSQYGDYYQPTVNPYDGLTAIDYQQNDVTGGWGGDGGASAWHMTQGSVAGTPYTLGVTLPGGTTRAHSSCAVELLAQ